MNFDQRFFRNREIGKMGLSRNVVREQMLGRVLCYVLIKVVTES